MLCEGLLVWRRMHSAARSSSFRSAIKFCNVCFDKLNILFKWLCSAFWLGRTSAFGVLFTKCYQYNMIQIAHTSILDPETASLPPTHLSASRCQRKHLTFNWTSWLRQAGIQNTDLYLQTRLTVHESTETELSPRNKHGPSASLRPLKEANLLLWMCERKRANPARGISVFEMIVGLHPGFFFLNLSSCFGLRWLSCTKGRGDSRREMCHQNFDRLVPRIKTAGWLSPVFPVLDWFSPKLKVFSVAVVNLQLYWSVSAASIYISIKRI